MTLTRCTRCAKYGHKGAACPDRRPSTTCTRCWNLPHRRAATGCDSCGLPFAADVIAKPDNRRWSSVAEMESF